ncbi:diacylglycerol/lipid kinase family protein [Metabacillus arenae]|uniref:YegS/Rv2252/BmrU family lipid kinase n=1 Tax=Metabacillus arenae TaxID=2771434 RepID=A0A926RVR8_9BACI|nr:YegS/Rv2252/BmrU family lipid kinase [Metabacillus arenae]MBD1378770.1 YegS/Rv2252/BmrU family lipid kinase [Metabacillus arenae]
MFTNKSALLLYNGNAGQKDIEKVIGMTVPLLSQQVGELVIRATQNKDDARKYCFQNGELFDFLFILGGDGTIHECINGLAKLEKRPVIGIIPGGTCNDLSRSLDIPQNIRKATETLLEGRVQEIDAARVNDHFFINFWGVGLIAETSANIDETEKSILGKISYFTSAIRTLQDMTKFSFHLVIDDKELIDDGVMVLVSNGRYIGTNELPFSLNSLSDGLLDVLVINEANLKMIKEIVNLKDERQWDKIYSEIQRYQGEKISFHTDPPREVDTDGEVYLKTPAEINILKRHFKVLVSN